MNDETSNAGIPQGLNAFSRRFLKALLKQHPEWARYAKVGTIYPQVNAAKFGTLLMRIPRPSGPGYEYLQLSTLGEADNPEITVEFGGTHTHIERLSLEEEQQASPAGPIIEAALALVREIVEEATIACAIRKGSVASSGGFVEPGGLNPAWRTFVGRDCRLRSWNGTFDEDKVLTMEDIRPWTDSELERMRPTARGAGE